MDQLLIADADPAGFDVLADLPVPTGRATKAALLAIPWRWREEFLTLFYTYLTYRVTDHWRRAAQTLQEARTCAIADEQWELESWVNELIVEASAHREAKRR